MFLKKKRLRQYPAANLKVIMSIRLCLSVAPCVSSFHVNLWPFVSPNDSHAKEHGRMFACANTPPPTMKLYDTCSLNRKSSPGLSALNGEPDGDQRFTSDKFGMNLRRLNHSLSVTAMTNSIVIFRSQNVGSGERFQVGQAVEVGEQIGLNVIASRGAAWRSRLDCFAFGSQ